METSERAGGQAQPGMEKRVRLVEGRDADLSLVAEVIPGRVTWGMMETQEV